MFDQIIDASKGKQIVMFLDYDGTLSPIVDDPDRAFMSDAVCSSSHNHISLLPILFGWLLINISSCHISDEKNSEKTCKVFSHCHSKRQMQRQGTLKKKKKKLKLSMILLSSLLTLFLSYVGLTSFDFGNNRYTTLFAWQSYIMLEAMAWISKAQQDAPNTIK